MKLRTAALAISVVVLGATFATPAVGQIITPSTPPPPTITAPVTATITPTGGTVTGVSITTDASKVSVALKASGGTIDVDTTGLQLDPYFDGSGDKWLTITAPIGDINDALSQLTFTPSGAGPRSISMKVISDPVYFYWNPDNDHLYIRDYAAFPRNYAATRSYAAGHWTHLGLDGYLATVTSADGAAFLEAHSPAGSGDAYVSGSDADGEGTWKYTDGPEAGQTFYAAGAAVDGFYNGFSTNPGVDSSQNSVFLDGDTYVPTDGAVTTQLYWAELGDLNSFEDPIANSKTIAITTSTPTTNPGPSTPVTKALTGTSGSATVDPATKQVVTLPVAQTPIPTGAKSAPTPSGTGSWTVNRDGGVFTAGSAPFLGSRGGQPLNAAMVSITGASSGTGYWTVASDGGVFSYGSAPFYGSAAGSRLNQPVVQLTETCSKNGYYLTASDGGVFTYGGAQFYGSMGGKPLNKGVIGLVDSCNSGYYLFAEDGGVFTFGGAQFHGSLGSQKLSAPVTAMVMAADGNGYWLLTTSGTTTTAYGFGSVAS